MSVMPSKSLAKCSPSKWKMVCFPILALVFGASGAWAQAPSVLVDAQQTLGTGFNSPQSIAVSKNGTIFIADTNNSQIVAIVNGVKTPVSTGTFVLSTPQAIALDANGDLFVGDTPASGGTTSGRILELVGDGKGNLTGVAKLIFSGAPLTNPISLTFDSTGTLFIGDYPPSDAGAIYSLASGGTTPQLLNITGLSPTVIPGALLRDSSTNLYIADNGSFSGSVYLAPDTGGAAQPVDTGSFVINQPSGLAFDSAGDLFILSLLGSGTGFNAGQQVVIIPAASPTTPYILPNTGLGTSSSMAFDPQGNLDVLDSADGLITQLDYLAPVNMGNIDVGQTGSQILFNFEFNAPTTLRGFRFVSQGDTGSELLEKSGGTCTNGRHTNLPGGGPSISPYFPYTCSENFLGSPAYPGIRSSAIQVKGTGTTILASTPVYQTGLAGAEVTYPVNEATTATALQQPQALAISGLDNKVYVADTQAGKVYSIAGLGGTTLTPVSTGTIAIQAPSALALDGAGDLFIADFNLGEVIEVPTTTGLAPAKINTGGLLQHPIALAFDFLGNLYIGDAGPGGVNAGTGNPGFVVKLPVGGAPFKMTIPSVSIIFPQALATDPKTAALWIGDGGDPSGVGQVVQVSADGTTATTSPINGVTNPTGLAFDPGDDLYVLDGTANTVTVVPPSASGLESHTLDFNNTTLAAASALAVSSGGQSFIIANIGTGSSNNLVYLNGNASKLAFGDVNVGSQSQPMTATEYNIGNLSLTVEGLQSITNPPGAPFSALASSTCEPGLVLASSASCTINLQFTPQFIGTTTQEVTVTSSGYNSDGPILTLTGTGTQGGAVRKGGRRR